jgi:hypothetical protein
LHRLFFFGLPRLILLTNSRTRVSARTHVSALGYYLTLWQTDMN